MKARTQQNADELGESIAELWARFCVVEHDVPIMLDMPKSTWDFLKRQSSPKIFGLGKRNYVLVEDLKQWLREPAINGSPDRRNARPFARGPWPNARNPPSNSRPMQGAGTLMDQKNRGNNRWKPIQPSKAMACLDRILPFINDDLSVPFNDPLAPAAFPFGRVYVEGKGRPIKFICTFPDLVFRLTLSDSYAGDPRPALSDVDFRDHLTRNDIVRVEFLASRRSRNQLWQDITTGKRETISLDDYRRLFPTTNKELAYLKTAPIPFPLRTDDRGREFLVSRELVAWHEQLAAFRRESEGQPRANGNGSRTVY